MKKNKLKKALIIILIFSWFFAGWPVIWQSADRRTRIPPKVKEAQAAAPAFQAASGIAASIGEDVIVTLPAHGKDDIFLLQVIVRDVDDVITVTDWTQIATVDRGTNERHWWFWKRAISTSETNPLVDKNTASGDTFASVTSYRGAITSSDPWEVKGTPTTGTNQNAVLNGITTLTDSSLVVASINEADNFVTGVSFSATDPSSLTTVLFVQSPTGSDGTNAAGAAAKTNAGATGNVSAAWTKTPDGWGGIVLALKPLSNLPPSLTISQPDGVSDTVVVGQSYDIAYDLSDTEDVATVDFYYDSDGSGLDGTAISGCQDQAEGTGAICSWSTTDVTAGDYYVYGIATDGVNPEVNDYSPGVITIQAVVYSVAVTPEGTIEYGSVNQGANKSTIDVSSTQTAENTGNVTGNFNIKTSNAVGGTEWTVGASAGTDVYVHEFSTNGGGLWTKFDDAINYKTLSGSVGVGSTVNFDLRITIPTDSSDAVQKTITVTVQAAAP